MIESVVEAWLDIVHGKVAGDVVASIDALLSDDVVFYSPVVFTPQKGKAVTKLYLAAAGASLGGESSDAPRDGGDDGNGGGFLRFVQL